MRAKHLPQTDTTAAKPSANPSSKDIPAPSQKETPTSDQTQPLPSETPIALQVDSTDNLVPDNSSPSQKKETDEPAIPPAQDQPVSPSRESNLDLINRYFPPPTPIKIDYLEDPLNVQTGPKEASTATPVELKSTIHPALSVKEVYESLVKSRDAISSILQNNTAETFWGHLEKVFIDKFKEKTGQSYNAISHEELLIVLKKHPELLPDYNRSMLGYENLRLFERLNLLIKNMEIEEDRKPSSLSSTPHNLFRINFNGKNFRGVEISSFSYKHLLNGYEEIHSKLPASDELTIYSQILQIHKNNVEMLDVFVSSKEFIKDLQNFKHK